MTVDATPAQDTTHYGALSTDPAEYPEGLPVEIVAALRQAWENGIPLATVARVLGPLGYEVTVSPCEEMTDDDEELFARLIEGDDEPDEDDYLMSWDEMVACATEGVAKGYSFHDENKTIARNRRRKVAADAHEFKAARWATRSGKVRCVICGKVQPEEGPLCAGLAKDGEAAAPSGPDVNSVHVDTIMPGRKKPQGQTVDKAETYDPPQGVQAAAKRALEWIADGKAGDGFTDVGRKRAADLARGAAISRETVGRMANYFGRHESDKQAEGFNAGEKGYPTPGRVAWDAWGGDPGASWVRGIMDRADKAVGPHKFKTAEEGDNCATCSQPRDNWRHRSVSKAVDEQRFTMGPMYVPDTLDAHGEWASADELQQAVWNYVRSGDRRIRLQHNREVVAGEWTEILTWPWEVTCPMLGTEDTLTFPANTVFLGVVWEPWAWELVKAGKLRGYSIGGKAERVLADLPDPGDVPATPDPTEKAANPGILSEDFATALGNVIAEAMKAHQPVINVVLPSSVDSVKE